MSDLEEKNDVDYEEASEKGSLVQGDVNLPSEAEEPANSEELENSEVVVLEGKELSQDELENIFGEQSKEENEVKAEENEQLNANENNQELNGEQLEDTEEKLPEEDEELIRLGMDFWSGLKHFLESLSQKERKEMNKRYPSILGYPEDKEAWRFLPKLATDYKEQGSYEALRASLYLPYVAQKTSDEKVEPAVQETAEVLENESVEESAEPRKESVFDKFNEEERGWLETSGYSEENIENLINKSGLQGAQVTVRMLMNADKRVKETETRIASRKALENEEGLTKPDKESLLNLFDEKERKWLEEGGLDEYFIQDMVEQQGLENVKMAIRQNIRYDEEEKKRQKMRALNEKKKEKAKAKAEEGQTPDPSKDAE